MPWRRLGLLVTIISLLAVSTALAISPPSFHLDSCAYHATEIVVAAQEPGSEGKLVVLESWKGSLTRGTRFTLPDFPPAPMEAWDIRFYTAHQHVTITGTRIVLFLKPAANKSAGQWVGVNDELSRNGPLPLSIVWIEAGEAYTYRDSSVGGGYFESTLTEAQLKKIVQEVLAAKEELRKALAVEDLTERARILARLVRPQQHDWALWALAGDAFEALVQCGKSDMSVLRDMLFDERVDQRSLVRAIVLATGTDADVGTELTAIIEKELPYWQKIGPTLKPGWGEDKSIPQRGEYRCHWEALGESLGWLQGLNYAPAHDLVRQTRALWSTIPPIGDSGRDNEIIRACDRILDPKAP